MTRNNKPVVMNCETEFGPDWNLMPKKLVDLVPWVEKYLALVPEPYRNSASIDTVSFRDSPRDSALGVKVHYYRPETDDEMNKRLADEEAQKLERQKSEKQMLQDLKERFNDR